MLTNLKKLTRESGTSNIVGAKGHQAVDDPGEAMEEQ
jgi:hypothetical protein